MDTHKNTGKQLKINTCIWIIAHVFFFYTVVVSVLQVFYGKWLHNGYIFQSYVFQWKRHAHVETFIHSFDWAGYVTGSVCST